MSKHLVDYSRFSLVPYPSHYYSEIGSELRELYRLCEPDEERFEPLISPSQLIVGHSQGRIASFLVASETLEIQRRFPADFEEKGGVLGRKGLFVTSVCGDNGRYYGLLEGLFVALKRFAADRRYTYLLIHVSGTRPWLVPKYERQGFRKSGEFMENGKTFSVMNMTVCPTCGEAV